MTMKLNSNLLKVSERTKAVLILQSHLIKIKIILWL